MSLSSYVGSCRSSSTWLSKLRTAVESSEKMYDRLSENEKERTHQHFQAWIRTEELKAWYGSPETSGDLFQGTSISSLSVPYVTASPLPLQSIQELENRLADAYIELHDRHAATVRNAILEDVDDWIRSGLYYGVVLPSKVISQAFQLAVPMKNLIFDVDGYRVDPHQILTYPSAVREKYFHIASQRIACFQDLNLTQSEFESSLILADISKPKISQYKDHLLLAPVRCNEIASNLGQNAARLVREKTDGRIRLKSLSVTIFDTDTPYTYYKTMGYLGRPVAPVLPGLLVLGASGTMDAFRWLYSYRVSLIAQKMMKGSLYSEVKREFIPFVFFGVLVPRDAGILLDTCHLSELRYPGNLSPVLEFAYLLPKLKMPETPVGFTDELDARLPRGGNAHLHRSLS